MGLLSRGLILLSLTSLTFSKDVLPEKLIAFNTNPNREELSEQQDLLAASASQPMIQSTASRIYDYNNYDSLTARYAPQDPPSHTDYNKYVITEARLKEIRSQFMYWFFDKGGPSDVGDFQKDIHTSISQLHKNLNFQLPFYGSRFNYTRLSINGYLEFSDPPERYTYPLSFPMKDWPKVRDPAFIGIFFSKCRVGSIRPEDIDQRAAGVYFRLERDLMTRTDMFGVEVRERLMWDIREGVVGSETFIPKHAIIATWKNVTFAGGIDSSLYKTNTFQMILATDEVYTYAIFNYKDLQWTSHTEAGGDTSTGEGGVPAFVGFNAGNGTGSVEYVPYSQASVIRDLSGRGWANGFPGRHIFRLDEKIMLGTCNKDVAGTNLPLVFAPESGNMLGGTVVNITGPCFEPSMRVRCRFDTEEVIGTVVDRNRAICVQPYLMVEGYVRFEVSVSDVGFNWKGKYFVETPATALEKIHFITDDVHKKAPPEIKITWEKANLTTNYAASLTISLYGYKETTIKPQLMFIDILETSVPNTGSYVIQPSAYRARNNLPELLELEYGFLHINLTNPENYAGLTISPVLWSRPVPLGWYFNAQWERKYGKKWEVALCDRWLMYDRYLKNFAAEIPVCPCTQEHALLDKGRYLPDSSCDKDINPECYYHKGALHCVRSGAPSLEGSEQQCCYDKDGYLMMSYDQQWGSRPRRSHNLGFLPWNEANKVPTLSQWFHDIRPFYTCCMWQEEQAVGCETLRFERRPSQDCVAYQSPYVATVFGDPHIITFDNVEYTFNGKGEFVLVQANEGKELLNIQGRFEEVPINIYGDVAATLLTSIAAQDNSSSIIEVRLRQSHAQWRYRLDVMADKKPIYFDRPSLKMQHFKGVTIYTPTATIDQSEVIIMFPSGAGVEVVESKGYMSARVYLPWNFLNKTRGLFGNWSFDVTDEFMLPDGTEAGVSTNINSFESIHKNFAIKWLLEEGDELYKGQSLFNHDVRPSSYYTNKTFVPEYRGNIVDFVPPNRSHIIERANALCGQSYQCKYDYAMSLNEVMAKETLLFREKFIGIQKTSQKLVKSCGVLETPRFGRKSNFRFVPGTKVTFECNQDFTLVGDQRRTCLQEGRWDVPEYGYTECLRQTEYEQRTGWTAAGIILAVFVPIVLCILFAYMRAKKKKELSPFKSFRDSFLRSPGTKAFRDSLFTPSKKRVYDHAYRTNEPVADRPPVDFSDRESTLGSVDDRDIDALVDDAHARVPSSSDKVTSTPDEFDHLPNVERNVATSGSSSESEADAAARPSSKKSSKRSKSSSASSKTAKISDYDDSSELSRDVQPQPLLVDVAPISNRPKKKLLPPLQAEPKAPLIDFGTDSSDNPKSSDGGSPKAFYSADSSHSSPVPPFEKDSRFNRSSSSDPSDFSRGHSPPPLPPTLPPTRMTSATSSARSDSSGGVPSSFMSSASSAGKPILRSADSSDDSRRTPKIPKFVNNPGGRPSTSSETPSSVSSKDSKSTKGSAIQTAI